MPDIHESTYNAWIGRKATVLRRPTLDCGCTNLGEVSFHIWCDRLACQEHADAPHDCGEFKGSKSGIEEEAVEPEAVEPEAVVEAPAPRPLTLSPESYRALYGPWFDETHTFTRQELEEHVEALRPNANDDSRRLAVNVTDLPLPADIDEERRAQEDAAIQAVWDSVPCDTASPPATPRPVSRWPRLTEVWWCPSRCDFWTGSTRLKAIHEAECAAPPVDAALQPDPDVQEPFTEPERPPCYVPDPVSWWRRMLPGGTR